MDQFIWIVRIEEGVRAALAFVAPPSHRRCDDRLPLSATVLAMPTKQALLIPGLIAW